MKTFRQAIETQDLEAAVRLFAEDATFRSPAVHNPYQGRAQVEAILRAAMATFEDFRYERELADDRGHALVFRARVGDREVEGCDFLRTNEAGEIDELVVMIRPLSGLTALAQAMAEKLS
ncbi:nuclear transport factor 2 family protein [Amycolatopsis rhabdoformis]|uniref:Nuclear transport factor 2 family protein n=1 Tax=Amycolatopsis rhabdoformis TaxID=1448059 RepID=A0ABZ1I0D3_9PSEU|nr:nuclear transport factor 2 family protein [Amycolatopsis rhabdoformis]WSE27257.1 nuclear transport factor 2 family protein [Amycolatopsis rhabdoformis]